MCRKLWLRNFSPKGKLLCPHFEPISQNCCLGCQTRKILKMLAEEPHSYMHLAAGGYGGHRGQGYQPFTSTQTTDDYWNGPRACQALLLASVSSEVKRGEIHREKKATFHDLPVSSEHLQALLHESRCKFLFIPHAYMRRATVLQFANNSFLWFICPLGKHHQDPRFCYKNMSYGHEGAWAGVSLTVHDFLLFLTWVTRALQMTLPTFGATLGSSLP